MASSAESNGALSKSQSDEQVVVSLRQALTNESVPLARRFRALFSLKHLASQRPPTPQTIPAIEAIAAAFLSPSALLKHELAYCLGQTKNDAAIPYLLRVLQDRDEDAMCRHEAAEALGALAAVESLELLKAMKSDEDEPTVVRETCDIAVDRILWETSPDRKSEELKQRYNLPVHLRIRARVTDSQQRLRICRPSASSTSRNSLAFYGQPPYHSPRYEPTPLQKISGNVCASGPRIAARSSNRRNGCASFISRIHGSICPF